MLVHAAPHPDSAAGVRTQVMTHQWQIGLGTLLCSAAAAFALNCSIYVLIGKTSALTMNVAGVVKDVLLVYLSVAMYG